MNRKWLVLTTAIVMIGLTGCKMSPERALTEKPVETAVAVTTAPVTPVQTQPLVSEGELWNAKIHNFRPVAIMFDNHAGARPQAGLKDAEIVIEALAEGNITRYMGFFFEGMPESVGPIRSARPYFLDRGMEFNAIYVHVGGSPKALSDIKQLRISDLDGLSSSNKVFFRKKHKKIPHNLYSTLQILRTESEKKGYAQASTTGDVFYASEDTVPTGDASLYIKLPYRKNDGGYMVSYDYNASEKVYHRLVNGKEHLDEIDQTAIAAKNIIVQIVPTRVVDDAGRLDLEMVGSGDGWWLSDGIKMPIKWEKSSRKAITRYTTTDGREILLNPGKTWIQIIPKSMTIQWEKI